MSKVQQVLEQKIIDFIRDSGMAITTEIADAVWQPAVVGMNRTAIRHALTDLVKQGKIIQRVVGRERKCYQYQIKEV